MRMEGKVALVTGAGSGIGRATALRLAAEGARVACADLSGEHAEKTASVIVEAGGESMALALDVRDAGAGERVVREVVQRFGRLTTLVNSAGVRQEGMDKTPPPEEWERVVDINLTGTYFASRAALSSLAATGGGAITNLASIYGLVGGSLSPAYAASKAVSRTSRARWRSSGRPQCA